MAMQARKVTLTSHFPSSCKVHTFAVLFSVLKLEVSENNAPENSKVSGT
jgi:hypothetical protein